VDFYKILEVASITVVINWAPKEGSKKGNLLPWMRKDVLHHKSGRNYLFLWMKFTETLIKIG
jgi:hypothetical protein